MVRKLEQDIYYKIYNKTKSKRIKKKALKNMNFISRAKIGIQGLAKGMSLDIKN